MHGEAFEPRAKNDATARAATPRRRVLVVDDNDDAAGALKQLLEEALGNEVRIALDGLEAVDAARVFRPHVVVMDLGMPKLNGFEAARRIRALPKGDRVLLIALTGWSQNEVLRRSRDAGYDHLLVKPVDFGALQRLIAGGAQRRLD